MLSMLMADGADKGIIPLTTSELFRRVEERSAQDPKLSYIVEVSYIEIYNEKSASSPYTIAQS
jgi:kinesin family protein 1